MTAKELYIALDEDYNEVFDRIGNDKWIVKYLKKFTAEDYVAILKKAIDDSQWEDLFKASHSLKGLALNLGLSKLAKSSSDLCEAVRHGAPTVDVMPLFKEVESVYNTAIETIFQLD